MEQEGDSLSSAVSKEADLMTPRNDEQNQSLSDKEISFELELQAGGTDDTLEESEISTVSEASTPRQKKTKKRNRWRRNKKRSSLNSAGEAEVHLTGASRTASNEMIASNSADEPLVVTTYVCSSTELDKVRKLIDKDGDPIIEMPEIYDYGKPYSQESQAQPHPSENYNTEALRTNQLDGTPSGDTDEILEILHPNDNVIEIEELPDVLGGTDDELLQRDNLESNLLVAPTVEFDESPVPDNLSSHNVTFTIANDGLGIQELSGEELELELENLKQQTADESKPEESIARKISGIASDSTVDAMIPVEEIEVTTEIISNQEKSEAPEKSINSTGSAKKCETKEVINAVPNAKIHTELRDLSAEQEAEIEEMSTKTETDKSTANSNTENSRTSHGSKRSRRNRNARRRRKSNASKKSEAPCATPLENEEQIVADEPATMETEDEVDEIDNFSLTSDVSHKSDASSKQNQLPVSETQRGEVEVDFPTLELNPPVQAGIADTLAVSLSQTNDETATVYASEAEPSVISQALAPELSQSSLSLELKPTSSFKDVAENEDIIVDELETGDILAENEQESMHISGEMWTKEFISDQFPEKVMETATEKLETSPEPTPILFEADENTEAVDEPEWIASLLKEDEKPEEVEAQTDVGSISNKDESTTKSESLWPNKENENKELGNADKADATMENNVSSDPLFAEQLGWSECRLNSFLNESENDNVLPELPLATNSAVLEAEVEPNQTIELAELMEIIEEQEEPKRMPEISEGIATLALDPHSVVEDEEDEISTKTDRSVNSKKSTKSAKSVKFEKTVQAAQSNESIKSARSLKSNKSDDSLGSARSNTSIKSNSARSQKSNTSIKKKEIIGTDDDNILESVDDDELNPDNVSEISEKSDSKESLKSTTSQNSAKSIGSAKSSNSNSGRTLKSATSSKSNLVIKNKDSEALVETNVLKLVFDEELSPDKFSEIFQKSDSNESLKSTKSQKSVKSIGSTKSAKLNSGRSSKSASSSSNLNVKNNDLEIPAETTVLELVDAEELMELNPENFSEISQKSDSTESLKSTKSQKSVKSTGSTKSAKLNSGRSSKSASSSSNLNVKNNDLEIPAETTVLELVDAEELMELNPENFSEISQKSDSTESLKSTKSQKSVKSTGSTKSAKSNSERSSKSASSRRNVIVKNKDLEMLAETNVLELVDDDELNPENFSEISQKSDSNESLKSAKSQKSVESTKSAKSNSGRSSKSATSCKSNLMVKNNDLEIFAETSILELVDAEELMELSPENFSEISQKSDSNESLKSTKSQKSVKSVGSANSPKSVKSNSRRSSATSSKSNLVIKSQELETLTERNILESGISDSNEAATILKPSASTASYINEPIIETAASPDIEDSNNGTIASSVFLDETGDLDLSEKSDLSVSVKSKSSNKSQASVRSHLSIKSATSTAHSARSNASSGSQKTQPSRMSAQFPLSPDCQTTLKDALASKDASKKSSSSKVSANEKRPASSAANSEHEPADLSENKTNPNTEDEAEEIEEVSVRTDVSHKSGSEISCSSKKSDIKSSTSKNSLALFELSPDAGPRNPSLSSLHELSQISTTSRKSSTSMKQSSQKSSASQLDELSQKSNTSHQTKVSETSVSELHEAPRKSSSSSKTKMSEKAVSLKTSASKKSICGPDVQELESQIIGNKSRSEIAKNSSSNILIEQADTEDEVEDIEDVSVRTDASKTSRVSQRSDVSKNSDASKRSAHSRKSTTSIKSNISKTSVTSQHSNSIKSGNSRKSTTHSGSSIDISKDLKLEGENSTEAVARTSYTEQSSQPIQNNSKLGISVSQSQQESNTEKEIDDILDELPENEVSASDTINLDMNLHNSELYSSANITSKSSVNVIYKIGAALFPNPLQSLTAVDTANDNNFNPITGLPNEQNDVAPDGSQSRTSAEEMTKYEPSTEPSLGEIWMAGTPPDEDLNSSNKQNSTPGLETVPPLVNTDDILLNDNLLNNNHLQERIQIPEGITECQVSVGGIGQPPKTDTTSPVPEPSVSTDLFGKTFEYKLLDVPNPSVETRDGLINLDLIVPPPQLNPHSLTRIALIKRENPGLVNMARKAVDGILDSAQEALDAYTAATKTEESNNAENISMPVMNSEEINSNYQDGCMADNYQDSEPDTSSPFPDTQLAYESLQISCNENGVPVPGELMSSFTTVQQQEIQQQRWNSVLYKSELKEIGGQPSPSSSSQIRIVLSSNKSTGVNLSESSSITSLESNELFKLPRVPNPSIENQHGLANLNAAAPALDINPSSFARLITDSTTIRARKDASCDSHQQLELDLSSPSAEPSQLISEIMSNYSSTVVDSSLFARPVSSRSSSKSSVATLANRLPEVPGGVLGRVVPKNDNKVDNEQSGDDSETESDASDGSSTGKLIHDTTDVQKKLKNAFGNAKPETGMETDPKTSIPEPPGWIIDPKVIEDAVTESEIADISDPGKPSFIQSIFNCFGKKNRSKKSKMDSPATEASTATREKSSPKKTLSLPRKKNKQGPQGN